MEQSLCESNSRSASQETARSFIQHELSLPVSQQTGTGPCKLYYM